MPARRASARVRAKKSGKYEYLQVVHNQRVEGKVRQQVIGTLGDAGKAIQAVGVALGPTIRFCQQSVA